MQRCCVCFVFVCLFPTCLLGDQLLEYLRNYEGRWTGRFSIHSTANGFTESFPVEQRYWWKGEVLHGLSVSDRDAGMDFATSKTWVDGKKLITEVKRGETKEVFYGVLHEGTLLWLPEDMRRANDYQMRESFTEEEGREKMLFEGFDTYVFGEGLAHIIIKGELILQADSK